MNTKENKNNRRFDKGFKQSAVELMERGDRSLKQLGMELGVSVCSLRDWKKNMVKVQRALPTAALQWEELKWTLQLKWRAFGESWRWSAASETFKKSLFHFRPGIVERFALIETMEKREIYHQRTL